MAHPGIVVLLGITIVGVLYYMFGSGGQGQQQEQEHSNTRFGGRYTANNYYNQYNRGNDQLDNNYLIKRQGSDRVRNAEDCSICLDTLPGRKITLDCNHMFHEKCIEKWIGQARQQSCPNCRRLL